MLLSEYIDVRFSLPKDEYERLFTAANQFNEAKTAPQVIKYLAWKATKVIERLTDDVNALTIQQEMLSNDTE